MCLIRVGAKLCRDTGPPGPNLVTPDLGCRCADFSGHNKGNHVRGKNCHGWAVKACILFFAVLFIYISESFFFFFFFFFFYSAPVGPKNFKLVLSTLHAG